MTVMPYALDPDVTKKCNGVKNIPQECEQDPIPLFGKIKHINTNINSIPRFQGAMTKCPTKNSRHNNKHIEQVNTIKKQHIEH